MLSFFRWVHKGVSSPGNFWNQRRRNRRRKTAAAVGKNATRRRVSRIILASVVNASSSRRQGLIDNVFYKKAQLTRTNVRSSILAIDIGHNDHDDKERHKIIQGHCFRCQSKPVYDFLLVTNCNLWPYLAPFPRYGQLLVQNRKMLLPPSHLGPSIGVTPMELLEKRYRSWNQSLWGSRWWRFDDPSLHCFCLIRPCDRQTDRQNCDG